MNKLRLTIALITLFAFAGSGCKEYKRIDMTQVEQIYDSLKTIPGITSMHVLQDDDYTKVTIIIGDPRLYAQSYNVQPVAVKVGSMVLHVLGPDNNLSKGIFAVSKKDDDKDKIPDDGIIGDMKIDSLKKVIFTGK